MEDIGKSPDQGKPPEPPELASINGAITVRIVSNYDNRDQVPEFLETVRDKVIALVESSEFFPIAGQIRPDGTDVADLELRLEHE